MKNARLMIAETSTSTWNYHLRLVMHGEEKYSGGAGEALCGKALGWDTQLPLTSWGLRDHIPATYCATCEQIARANRLLGQGQLD